MSELCLDFERFAVHGLGAVEVAPGPEDEAEVAVLTGHALEVSELCLDFERFAVHGLAAVEVAPRLEDVAEVANSSRLHAIVVLPFCYINCAFEPQSCLIKSTEPSQEPCVVDECVGACGIDDGSGELDFRLSQFPLVGQVPRGLDRVRHDFRQWLVETLGPVGHRRCWRFLELGHVRSVVSSEPLREVSAKETAIML